MNGSYNFISNNVKGMKASEKRLKLSMALYFHKKHIRRRMMNRNGKTILGVVYFFHTEKAILVVWQLAIVEQKHLKW